jgi:Flp pilus assembly protein TadG
MRLRTSRIRSNSGQALVETVIITPLLLCLVLNAVNFAYFLLMAINLTAAPHHSVLYSIIGSQSPGTTTLPSAGPTTTGSCTTASAAAQSTVCYLTYQDMIGAINAPANAKVQVCSKSQGSSAGVPNCVSCSSGTATCTTTSTWTPDADPEPSTFVLNRVDVAYTFSPMIPGLVFGVVLLPTPACSLANGQITCTIHRQVSMRAID